MGSKERKGSSESHEARERCESTAEEQGPPEGGACGMCAGCAQAKGRGGESAAGAGRGSASSSRLSHVEQCVKALGRIGRLSALRHVVLPTVVTVAAHSQPESVDLLLEYLASCARAIARNTPPLPQYFHRVMEEVKELSATASPLTASTSLALYSSAHHDPAPPSQLLMSVSQLGVRSCVGVSDKLLSWLEYLHNVGQVVYDVASDTVCLRPQVLAKVMGVFVPPTPAPPRIAAGRGPGLGPQRHSPAQGGGAARERRARALWRDRAAQRCGEGAPVPRVRAG